MKKDLILKCPYKIKLKYECNSTMKTDLSSWLLNSKYYVTGTYMVIYFYKMKNTRNYKLMKRQNLSPFTNITF